VQRWTQSDTIHWRLAGGRDVEILNFLDDHSRPLVACDVFTTVKGADVVETFHLAGAPHGYPTALLTDSHSEFRSQESCRAAAKTLAQLRFIHAGQPQSNGCFARIPRAMLEECWRPTIARALLAKYTALRRDPVQYPRFCNFDGPKPEATPLDAPRPSWPRVLERCAHDESQPSTHPRQGSP